MSSSIFRSNITLEEFRSIRSRYPAVLKLVSDRKQPKKPKGGDSKSLEELDEWRDGVPELVRRQKGKSKSTDDLALDASTVKEIVNWKLKRGKFRPTILPLVSQNPIGVLEATVKEALSTTPHERVTALDTQEEDDKALENVSSMIKVLTKLKGIGPATATAILSAVFPDTIPMFSDEAFRWLMMDEKGKSGGWDRKIDYNAKEYAEFFKRVRVLCRKLTLSADGDGDGVEAGDVEKVGWVLGQEAVLGITVNKEEEEGEPAEKKIAVSELQLGEQVAGQQQQQKKGKKTKVSISSAKGEIARLKVPEELETTVGLSKTSAKRKDSGSAEISPPPLRRSKRNRET
ncbi:hypothetical protein ABW19_dt0203287 [Dactylella cylindrospora]|nr:hypothetical protein ABW19_dt0203287 [Dactylella cylindrospora]